LVQVPFLGKMSTWVSMR